jgi:hypothetical protein
VLSTAHLLICPNHSFLHPCLYLSLFSFALLSLSCPVLHLVTLIPYFVALVSALTFSFFSDCGILKCFLRLFSSSYWDGVSSGRWYVNIYACVAHTIFSYVTHCRCFAILLHILIAMAVLWRATVSFRPSDIDGKPLSPLRY